MKKVFLVAWLVFVSPEIYAQKNLKSIQASVVGFFNGLSLINPDTLRYYSTPDFHLLEDGHVWNLDTLISKVLPLKNSNITRLNKMEFIKIEQNGKIAWVSYNNSAEFRWGEKQQIVRWLESAVLVKNKGDWKIQMLHSTKLK